MAVHGSLHALPPLPLDSNLSNTCRTSLLGSMVCTILPTSCLDSTLTLSHTTPMLIPLPRL